MKIVHVKGGDYSDVLDSYNKWSDYDDGSTEDVLFVGYKSSISNQVKDKYVHYKRKAYLNWEAPCSFFTRDDAITSQAYFDRVYTICPYTAKWLNGKGKTQYIPVMHPYNEKVFEKYQTSWNKTKDVIYLGGLYSSIHKQMIDVMREHDYVFSSLNKYPHTTHRKIRSEKKWDLMASSKCSIAINLLFPSSKHISNIMTYDGWRDNEAFKQDLLHEVPQLKTRVIEAAACKTLNLVMMDDWNVMEYWFNPDEFVYWDSIEELDHLISDVKNNYYKYEPIVERAYQRAQQYTVNIFLKNVERNI